jgi:hypothetical protein
MIVCDIEMQKMIKSLLTTVDGEKVLQYLINSYVMSSPFSPNMTSLQLAYAEGRSDVVRLLHQITNSKI